MGERRCPACNARLGAANERRDPGAFPFCTRRCQTLDLAKWFDGNYRLANEDEAMMMLPDPTTMEWDT